LNHYVLPYPRLQVSLPTGRRRPPKWPRMTDSNRLRITAGYRLPTGSDTRSSILEMAESNGIEPSRFINAPQVSNLVADHRQYSRSFGAPLRNRTVFVGFAIQPLTIRLRCLTLRHGFEPRIADLETANLTIGNRSIKMWCRIRDSNSDTFGFKPNRYSNSRNPALVSAARFELANTVF
jgi:hypothetical protein